jgi:hypothetical protein
MRELRLGFPVGRLKRQEGGREASWGARLRGIIARLAHSSCAGGAIRATPGSRPRAGFDLSFSGEHIASPRPTPQLPAQQDAIASLSLQPPL